jgi:hypothetical protein
MSFLQCASNRPECTGFRFILAEIPDDSTVMPRLLSWPMLSPYGLYAELHRLHHGWNGIDLRDPERVQ